MLIFSHYFYCTGSFLQRHLSLVPFLFFILHSPLTCGAPTRSDLSPVLMTPPPAEIFRCIFPSQKWRGLFYSRCSAGPALTISRALIFSSPQKQNTNQAVIITITMLGEVESRLRVLDNSRKENKKTGGCLFDCASVVLLQNNKTRVELVKSGDSCWKASFRKSQTAVRLLSL